MVHGLNVKYAPGGGGKLGIYRYAYKISVYGKMTRGGAHLVGILVPMLRIEET